MDEVGGPSILRLLGVETALISYTHFHCHAGVEEKTHPAEKQTGFIAAAAQH